MFRTVSEVDNESWRHIGDPRLVGNLFLMVANEVEDFIQLRVTQADFGRAETCLKAINIE